MVLALESLHKGNNVPSVATLVVDKKG